MRALAYLHGPSGLGALTALLQHRSEVDIVALPPTTEDHPPPALWQLVRAPLGPPYDLVICAGWRKILTPDELAQAPVKVNLHAGALPKYRGRQPVQRAVADGQQVVLTLHHMIAEVDAGERIASNLLPWYPTAGQVYRNMVVPSYHLVTCFLREVFP